MCNEEAVVFNQTSPILSIRYHRPALKSLCLDSLAPAFTYLPVTRGQPPQLCVHIHLCPTPSPSPAPTSLNDYARTACLRNLSWAATPNSAVWSDALVSELQQIMADRSKGGCQERTFTSIKLKRSLEIKEGPNRTTVVENMWAALENLAHRSAVKY